MASSNHASLNTGSLVTLAVAFTLLLPVLPYSLLRLARFFTRSTTSTSHLAASLILAGTVALALYGTCALVAISGGVSTSSAAVAAGAFGCLVVLLRDATLLLLLQTHHRVNIHHASAASRRASLLAGSSLALLNLLLVAGKSKDLTIARFGLQAAGLALFREDQPLRAVNAARAALSIFFSCGLGALLHSRIATSAGVEGIRARDVEDGAGETSAAASARRRALFVIHVLALLGLSILVNIFSVAFPLQSPYARLSLPSGPTKAILPPSLVGTTHQSAVPYLLIAIAMVSQIILIVEVVLSSSLLDAGGSSVLPRDTTSFDSSFVDIGLPPPALPPRASRFNGPLLVSPTSPSSAVPSMTQISSASTPDTAARSTPSPRSHRSLPPLNITLTRPSLPATLHSPSPGSDSMPAVSMPSAAHSARHSFRRGSNSSSSSPTQLRTGAFGGSRQLRSGSYSSSLRRFSASPSATRLSSLFSSSAVAVSTSTPSMGPGSTRRRSSSVGSLLRSVVSPGVPVPPTYAPSTATDWEVEPNEGHDDPFARPPPTPSSTTSTPGPIATPTRTESLSGGLGGIAAATRLVIALEAIEEPENGSPQNLSLDEGHGEAVDQVSTSSEGDHVERVLTPMPHEVEHGRSRSNSLGSLFREHLFDCDTGISRGSRTLSTSAVFAQLTSEPSTPTAAGPQPFVPESPPRRRTDRRASSPARPDPSVSMFREPEDTMRSSAPSTPVLARSRSTSASLFSPGKLISIRRFRSSLRRAPGRLSPAEPDKQSSERPSESSELSFACQGADQQAGLPFVARPQLLGLAPPADVRLSVGSRKAWWKHMSTGSRASPTDDSHIFRDFSQGPAAVLGPAAAPSLLRSSWSSQSFASPAAVRAPRVATSANARWSGYELPPLADISPLSSSLFLPLPRRSGSSKRKSLRRIESSPAMIENAYALPEPTLLSLHAPSSKLSAGSFKTARTHLRDYPYSGSTEPTLEVELDELGTLVQTFIPDGTLSSPSSSAPYTPMSPSFDSIAATHWSRGGGGALSPVTPVSACSD